MLISFHCCLIFIFQILRNRKRLKCIEETHSKTVSDESDLENHLIFDPPVYRQRYAKVYETLLDEKWRNNIQKLVDFGCAEFGLFVFIKNLNIKQILFVDIDEILLQEKIGRIEPLLVDQLRRRNCPLEVSVFAGSVADPDYRLQETDVVTAIELIEHLYPDTLDAFPYNIFSFIEPKVVLITTPNADFNVMFKREGFRHPDHKFEWTREQFEDWAKNIVERFPTYTVEFSGIGDGPEDTKDIGCCSQLAMFLRKDLLPDEYISPIYTNSCLCDNNSLCKEQPAESKLLCNCVCPLCLPKFSVGICTYLSTSKESIDDNAKKESHSTKSHSNTNLEYKFQPTYYTFSEEKCTNLSSYINPSYNIYYNLIQKIDYPYEIDTRSEKERLLQIFQYRIQTFSHVNSRFYVSIRERCEIPITDIMYGDIDVSLDEVSHLLINAGYQIEKCIIQETGSCEDCIISVPREMDEITSSSEVTDSYSSKSSEPKDSTKFEANVESLSDWDEITYSPGPMQQDNTSSSVQPSSEPDKPNPDPLFDSGYLKSPSPLETNSKLPPPENPELAETDQFEDGVSTPSLSCEDNKLHLKKSVAKEKFVAPLMLESQKQKYDPNRVNELDRFHNMSSAKTFMNNFLRPQNEFKKAPFKEMPVAGPSGSWKKTRKFKDKKPIEKKEIVEPSPLDDAKSITNCIIQNSLNKIDVGDEIIARQAELIRDLSPPPQEVNLDIVAIQEQQQAGRVGALEVVQEALVLPQGVENGDLANNNRDNEGNNFVAYNEPEQDIDEGIDLLNDNLEDLMPLLEDNINILDNNNELAVEGNILERAVPIEHVDIVEVEENVDGSEIEKDGSLEADDSVAHASREALFDINSEQDLLDDFDIPPQAIQEDILDMLNLGGGLVLVGLHSVSSSGTRRDNSPTAASIQTNTNSFPDWLLQILGTHVPSEEIPAVPLGSHDEPHFYCQGDGLGVHPSVIAVEIDEAEDADNDTSSEESTSSNNTADFAEVEPGPSDMFDMSSLPEESSLANSLGDDSSAQVVRPMGSVVWSEQRPSDVPLKLRLINSEHNFLNSDHIENITEVVNDIIRTAVREVIIRSQRASNASLIVPNNSEADLSESQSSCIISMSSSHNTIDSEERSRNRVARPVITIPESVESDVSVEQCQTLIDRSKDNVQEGQSSSGSEESEYFET